MTPATLRSIRARLDLNQSDFAKLVGTGQSQISELERERRDIPRMLALAVIAVGAGMEDAESIAP